jgi:hypothetical protein
MLYCKLYMSIWQNYRVLCKIIAINVKMCDISVILTNNS